MAPFPTWACRWLPGTLLLAISPALALPPPPPLPPPEPALLSAPQPTGVTPGADAAASRQGDRLLIHGVAQRARWLWLGPVDAPPRQLWLPLEVLQERIGVSSRSLADGSLELEWFGSRLLAPRAAQQTLGDEVGLDVAPLLQGRDLRIREEQGGTLSLSLPEPRLTGIRSAAAGGGLRRVVLDLSGPALLRREDRALDLALLSETSQLAELERLGLQARRLTGRLRLSTTGNREPERVFTLGEPDRVVVDLPLAATTTAAAGQASAPAPSLDPRLQARLGRGLRWDRLVREIGGRAVRINAVRIDPRSSDLELRTLRRRDGMEGLSSLLGLARREDALVAINGGFFNRIRRLPLGALRERGAWLSGPILNRGAIGWQRGSLPQFGRLRLQEWMRDGQGNRWALTVLNSGFVQRGLSRYTADWGPAYRSLSDGESAVLVQQGQVRARFGSDELSAGIPLRPGDWLLVGRGGMAPPWQEGEPLSLVSQVSEPLGEAPFVLGGGPLLLQAGRPVLNGVEEGFSAAFLSQGAPRTVIGSDGRELWLLTLEGSGHEGPTLAETTLLLRQLGLRDALNLDGGSSTGLVMGGLHTVMGRGVAGAVHNGLGLVPAREMPLAGPADTVGAGR